MSNPVRLLTEYVQQRGLDFAVREGREPVLADAFGVVDEPVVILEFFGDHLSINKLTHLSDAFSPTRLYLRHTPDFIEVVLHFSRSQWGD